MEGSDGWEIIKDGENILAVVIRSNYSQPGLNFLTPDHFPLQLGVHNQKKGLKIGAHAHIPIIELKNINAQEIFYIDSGKVKIGLFNKEDQQVKEIILNGGDAILLEGGHSVEFLEDTKLFEFKQGPYRGKEKEKRMLK